VNLFKTSMRIRFSIIMILFWFSLYAYIPQMVTYAKEMGASYRFIGFIAGAYGLSQTILRIPFGILSDKFINRKLFVLFGIICSLLSAMIIYILPNPYTLLVARLLAGIASATWVNFTVLFLSYFSPYESSKSIGISISDSKIGQFLAMFIGGHIAISFGVRYIFLLCIITAIIAFIFCVFVHENNINRKERVKLPEIFSIISNRRIVFISLLGCMSQLITYSTTFGFTPIIASTLGADSLQLSYLSTVNMLPQIAFSILSTTIFSKKFGENKTLLAGFILLVVICVLTPFSPSINILYIIQFLSGIGTAITFTILMSMVIKGVDYHQKSTTMGFYQAFYGIGMMLGPMLLGAIGDKCGLTIGFMIVGILGLMSIWAIIKYMIFATQDLFSTTFDEKEESTG
jgi:MFS family permease